MGFIMKINQNQKKYGLHIPKRKKKIQDSLFESNLQPDNEISDNEKNNKSKLNVPFSNIEVKRNISIETSKRKALEQDPLIFDYDAAFDKIKESRDEKEKQDKIDREKSKKTSRYVESLKAKSKVREIERERIRERRLLNERKIDDHLYKDKEKFVTSTYKAKLVENKKWDEEDKRLESIEKAKDVTKRGAIALTEFYSSLQTKNISMGGNIEKNVTSAYTTSHLLNSTVPDKNNGKTIEKDAEISTIKKRKTHDRSEAMENLKINELKENENKESIGRTNMPIELFSSSDNKDKTIAEARERFLARRNKKKTNDFVQPEDGKNIID